MCCNICGELIPVDVVMVMMAVWLFVILDLPFAAKAPTLSSDHNTKEEADHRHDGAEYIYISCAHETIHCKEAILDCQFLHGAHPVASLKP